MNLRPLEPFGVCIEVTESSEIPPVETLLQLLNVHSLVLVRGAEPFSRESFLRYARGEAEQDPFLQWDFGPVMDLVPQENPKNYLFSQEAVPFHWDGAFFRVPHVLVFNCIAALDQRQGGETIFANTELLLEKMPSFLKNDWGKISLTYETEKLAHYGGKFTTKLIETHPITKRSVIRFAEAVETKLNPVSLRVEGTTDDEEKKLCEYLSARLYQRDVCYQHQWQRGDLLLADNHALLHGRNALRGSSNRHIQRIQLR